MSHPKNCDCPECDFKDLRKLNQMNDGEMTDTELLDFLEQSGSSLINNDAGHWAVTSAGWQETLEKYPGDLATTFLVEKSEWRNSIREAIGAFVEQCKEREHD